MLIAENTPADMAPMVRPIVNPPMEPANRLVVAANRDEYHARATALPAGVAGSGKGVGRGCAYLLVPRGPWPRST